MNERGAIRSTEAYALGKMLDHSGWQRGDKLVRLITPSDIDACWDNKGHVLFAEFSSQHSQWDQIAGGQRWLYESCVKSGPHCAVLCKHSVSAAAGRPINSRDDIESFHPMIYDHGLVFGKVVETNEWWQRFVGMWFDDPLQVRRKIFGKEAGL